MVEGGLVISRKLTKPDVIILDRRTGDTIKVSFINRKGGQIQLRFECSKDHYKIERGEIVDV